MIEFYFSKITHFFWPPREQQIISSNTLQGTESYICLLEALGQTHPWSNSTDANGGSSIANLKCSKVMSQVGGKKKSQKSRDCKRAKKRKVDLDLICLLVSEFWGLCVSVFLLKPLEKLKSGCTWKLRFPPQHRLSGAWISRKAEIAVQLVVNLRELATPS